MAVIFQHGITRPTIHNWRIAYGRLGSSGCTGEGCEDVDNDCTVLIERAQHD